MTKQQAFKIRMTVLSLLVPALLALFLMLMQAENIVYRHGVLDLDSDAAFVRKEKESRLSDALLSPTFILAVTAWVLIIFVNY